MQATEQVVTPAIQLYLRRGFEIGQITRVFPFVWNRKEGRPRLRTGWWNTLIWLTNILITTAYSIFVCFRCIQHLKDPEGSLAVQVYLQFTVVYYIFPAIFIISIGLKREAIMDLAVQSINFINWIDNNMNFKAKKLMKTSEFMLFYIFYGLISISAFVVLYAFIFPQSPEMISSVLPNGSWHIAILCALFQAYIEFIFHTQCFLVLFGCLAAIVPCWAVASETRLAIELFSFFT